MDFNELLWKSRMRWSKQRLREKMEALQTELEARTWRQEIVEKKFDRLTGRVLFLCDMHFPFVRMDLVDEIFKREKTVRLIVLGGDILGFDDMAFFRRLRSSTFEVEMDQAKSFFPLLRKQYPKAPILFIMSNHEFRLRKHLVDNIKDQKAADHLSEMAYQFLAVGVPNFHLIYLWWLRIGDTIFGHRESRTSVAGRHVTAFIDWLLPRVDFELKAVFQAHGHKQREVMWKGVKGVEVGALCKTLDWTRFSARQTVTYQDLWVDGYGVADFKNGKVDINSARAIFLDKERL